MITSAAKKNGFLPGSCASVIVLSFNMTLNWSPQVSGSAASNVIFPERDNSRTKSWLYYLQNQALQIFTLGMVYTDRMISRLGELVEYSDLPRGPDCG